MPVQLFSCRSISCGERALPGLYLRPFQRATYYAALQAADEGRLEPWSQLLLEGFAAGCLVCFELGTGAASFLRREP